MNEQDRLQEIIGRYADDTATAAEIAELNMSLKNDAQLRTWYLQYIHLDVALSQTLITGSTSQRKPHSPNSRGIFWAAVASITIAMLLWQPWYQATPPKIPMAFATLVAAKDAVWSDPNTDLALHGGQLPTGLMRLSFGTAEFLLADGATVVLHGPAAMEFRSRKHIFIEQGRLFCRCPSVDSRITVDTPATEVIDLGTEFSVEARSDLSTWVAVLNGEVQVGKKETRLLQAGEAVQVRGDGILVVQPIDRSEFTELLVASPTVSHSLEAEKNLLQDAGFEQGLSQQTWNGTAGNLQIAADAGRTGNAIRILSNGIAHWPQCRQELRTGDISGKLVVASVWAAPDQSHLLSRQQAMLKITFVNAAGRDFGFALRRFLSSEAKPNQYIMAQLAAIAPAGTERVQMQLMFQTHLKDTGAVLFDDAKLVIADSPINTMINLHSGLTHALVIRSCR